MVMTMQSCSVPGCTDRYYAKGLCGKHYTRSKKGQPLETKSRYQLTPQEKFELKFTKDASECWNWHFSDPKGRANTFLYNGKVQRASRVSYQLYIGPIPAGLCVLHECDNALCVNPKHLFLGTHKDNTQDMYNKKRNINLCGEDRKHSKLTNEAVQDIRSSPLNGNQLAKKYNVTRSIIYDVIHRRSWKHLP